MGKAEANKFKKLNTILDSAFDLFTDQGVENTSIAEIAQRAGVAKGTFYLYFQDKHELRNRLIYHKSSKLFKEAADALESVSACKSTPMSFEDKIVFIADYIINKLSENKILLSFISKNLSWGVFKKALTNNPTDRAIFTINVPIKIAGLNQNALIRVFNATYNAANISGTVVSIKNCIHK